MVGTLSSEDLYEIEALSVEWAWLLDHGRPHDIAGLLADEAVLNLFGEDWGPDDFRAWADQRAARPGRKTHHQITNVRVRPASEDRATGHASLVLRATEAEQKEPSVQFVGEYRDEYVRTAGGWRVARRALVPLGRGG